MEQLGGELLVSELAGRDAAIKGPAAAPNNGLLLLEVGSWCVFVHLGGARFSFVFVGRASPAGCSVSPVADVAGLPSPLGEDMEPPGPLLETPVLEQ